MVSDSRKGLSELRAYVQRMGELGSAIALAGWDQRTYMPGQGVEARARMLGRLSRLQFEWLITPKLAELLSQAEDELAEEKESPFSRATDIDRALVRHWRREHHRFRAIPPDLCQRFVEVTTRAESAWETARARSDFALFQPHLEEIVELVRRIADHLGYLESPYDALLDIYEPGMTKAKLAEIVALLRAEIVPFLTKLISSGTVPRDIPRGPVPPPVQRELCLTVLRAIGYDLSAGRMDETAHPFTTRIGPGDIRITNRYHEDDFLSALFSALHEGGHALYEQGLAPELSWTGLDDGASNGMHESQSRLWENQVGRSLPFWEFLQLTLAEHLPVFRDISPQEIWRGVNRVQPSPIRIEADEVTYNLHIALRFELEVELVEGRLRVALLPERWDDAMEQYLGIQPANDAQGVLQDVHWSGGMFGYFPSYMLGNLYAAQIIAAAERAIPDLWNRIRAGDLAVLREWLREEIYQHGRSQTPEELLIKVTGEGPSPKPFLDYVAKKYSNVYKI